MEARQVVWLSLIGMGYLLTLFIPVQAIFGFSIGIFFAALAWDSIKLKGILFYLCFYFVHTLYQLPMLQAISVMPTLSHPLLLQIANTGIMRIHSIPFWRPDIEQAKGIYKLITNMNEAVAATNSSNAFWVYGLMVIVMPIFWFFSCRRIIKKYHIKQRLSCLA